MPPPQDNNIIGGGILIIEVERGLESLKDELDKRGYNTFYSGEGKLADAVLYSGDSFPRRQYESSYVKISAGGNIKGSQGALLISVDNKDIDEIIHILTNRRYSPLF